MKTKKVHNKQYLLVLLCLLCLEFIPIYSNAQSPQPWSANWIWTSEQGPDNIWLDFRKKVTLTSKPTTAITRIAAENKYWLFINGSLIVRDGGLDLHPDLKNTYYDSLDIAPYLNAGDNVISALVWHKGGHEGYTQIALANGGFLFDSKLTGTGISSIISDNTWKIRVDSAFNRCAFSYKYGISGSIKFDNTTFGGDPIPGSTKFGFYRKAGSFTPFKLCANQNQSFTLPTGTWDVAYGSQEHQLMPGNDYKWLAWPVSYDARNEKTGWQALDYDDTSWGNAVNKGIPPVAPWNNMVYRTIPFWKDYGLTPYQNQSSLPTTINTNTTVTGVLGINIQGTPYLKVNAPAGVNIRIVLNDFYYQEYITKGGEQEFDCYQWQNSSSHNVKYIFTNVTGTVQVLGLKFRQVSYNSEVVGSFSSNDENLNTLWTKCKNTSRVCMRDYFVDCPDRERGQWSGDVSEQILYSFYLYDEAGQLLIKKWYREIMNTQQSDGQLWTTAPGKNCTLPDQNMAAVAMLWNYYLYTGDKNLLTEIYPQTKKFIQKCAGTANNDGMLILENGGGPTNIWNWIDWGNNMDVQAGSANTVCNALYIVLLNNMINIADALGQTDDKIYYQSLQTKVKSNFNNYFWNGNAYVFFNKNGQKSSTIDDRSNAWAVLAEMVDDTKKQKVMDILKTNYNAGPYQEMYIEMAMFKLDPAETLKRMRSRYAAMITSWSSTLWEMFPADGGNNHAWTAGPLYHLSANYLGIRPTQPAYNEFAFLPRMCDLKQISGIVPTPHGNITASCIINSDNSTLIQEITSPTNTICIIGIPKHVFSKSITIKEIKVGFTLIWQNGAVVGNVPGISYFQEDSEYIMFKALPGNLVLSINANEPANAGISAIISPEPTIGLINAEPIKVSVFNENKTAQNNIPVSYSINNGSSVNEVIATIPAQSSVDFVFAQKADMSTAGLYKVAIKITPVGDIYAIDDTLSTNVSVVSDWALLCPGIGGEKINIANANDLNMTTPFTIEAWVYPVVFKSNIWDGSVISKETDTSGYSLSIGGNGQGRFVINSGGAWFAAEAPAGSFKLNSWQHLAGVYDGSTIKFYVNGVLKATSTTGIPATSTGTLCIGETANTGWGDRSFNGGIDEVKIWNKAFTISELNDYKDYRRSGNEAGLIAYYRFNEGINSTIINDLTGKNHTGSLINLSSKTAWMQGINLPLKNVSGITNIENNKILIYPNPANDKIFLQFPEECNDLAIKLVDLAGNTLFSENKLKIAKGQIKLIDIRNFANGAYIVVVNDTFRQKVVKLSK